MTHGGSGDATGSPGRRLGATDLPVSPIGLGLAALGRPGYINLGRNDDLGDGRSAADMERRAHEVLDEAWRLGVRYLDAARSYGLAEAFLGRWLVSRGVTPADVTVGSKWGYTYTAAWRVDAPVHEVKELSLETFDRQWPESRAELGDHLDLYQIHSLTLANGALERPRLLGALAAAKGAGVRIGFSASGPDQARTIDAALAVDVDGVRLFDAVQATWNPLEPSAGAALQAAHAGGVGVIVKESLANGRLTPRGAGTLAAPGRASLRALSAHLGAAPDAAVIAGALARPWVDVVLSGATTRDQIRSNLGALDVVWDDEAEGLLAALREPPTLYWARRGELDWN